MRGSAGTWLVLAGLLCGSTGAWARTMTPVVDTSSITAAQLYKDAMGQLAAGERGRAEDLLKRCLQVDAHDVRACYALGTLLEQDGKPQDALSWLELGVSIEHDHPRLLTNLGIVYMQVGRLDDAEQTLVTASRLAPTSPYPINALGLLRERQQRYDDARQCFRQALTVDPGFGDAHVNLGLLALSQRQTDEARQEFAAAGSQNAAALNGLGVLSWFQGRHDDAERQFDGAVTVDPTDPTVRYNLALYLSSVGHYEEARYYLTPLENDPATRGAAQVLEAAIERQENHPAVAMDILQRALQSDPGLVSAHALLGLVAYEANDLPEAELHLSAAVDLKSQDPAVYNDLGLVLQRKGMLEKAIEELERAVALAPDAADAQYNLGDACDLAGKSDEALVHLQRYLDLTPHAPDTAEIKRRLAGLKKRRR